MYPGISKQLLREYAQSTKRPRPIFNTHERSGKFSTRLTIPDSKGNTKFDIVVTPDVQFATAIESEHAAALLGLHKVEPTRGTLTIRKCSEI